MFNSLRSRPWLLAALAGAVVLLFVVVRAMPGGAGDLEVETAAAEHADVRRVVSTSGAVRALVTVEVGSQLSGQISALEADFNSVVAAGDVIARLDPQTYESRVAEAEASVAVARSTVEVQRANVTRAEANLTKAQNDFTRAEELRARGTVAPAAYDEAVVVLASARADLEVARAQLANADATLGQREAALDSARIDLDRTVITSPIDGVVISRDVDIGQTVAASLSAPILFTIAQDLTRVQIDAQVDEADIGQVREGQPVDFTVDAYPDAKFAGAVEQVRLSPTLDQNVVTYTVVISADNPQRRLLPGMTANVDIVTGERAGVLTVDNRALRFAPRGAAEKIVVAGADAPRGGGDRRGGMLARLQSELELTDDQAQELQSAMRQAFTAGGDGPPDRDAIRATLENAAQRVLTPEQLERFRALQSDASERRPGEVWVRRADGKLESRRVLLGVSDAARTEIVGGALEDGDTVVLRVREPAA